MRRLIDNDQNNGKALEVRFEVEGATYYVILAGMTIDLRNGKVKDIYAPTSPDEYFFIENETYKCESFTNYREAKARYDVIKSRFID